MARVGLLAVIKPYHEAEGLPMSIDKPVVISARVLVQMIEHRLKAYRAGAEINDLDYEELQVLDALQRMLNEHVYVAVHPA